MTREDSNLLEPGGFFGTYRVVRPLGRGGMGWVYLVDGPESGTRYAVKLLDPEVAKRNGEFVRRFVREAEFTLNVRNPNLVEVYDAGQDSETGYCYLTMEFMPGGSLRDVIDRSGVLSTKGAWSIARDVANALKFVDENGLVHRDVKPDNILFTADGRAKLTDLGVTRFSGPDLDDSSRTVAGRIVGTPGYIAPEQVMDPHAVDIRADIYSLGIILYEMLAGERPNASEGAVSSLAKAIRGNEPPDVRLRRPDVPERFARLIASMMKPDRNDRPASAAYLAELLEDPELLKMPTVVPQRTHKTLAPAAPRRLPTAGSAARVPTAAPAEAAAEGRAEPRDPVLVTAMTAVAIALVVLAGVVISLLMRK